MIEKASFFFVYHSLEQQKYTFFFSRFSCSPKNEMDFIKEIIWKEPLQINCDLDHWDSAQFMLKKFDLL